jgi:phenylacetate-CoA ligase
MDDNLDLLRSSASGMVWPAILDPAGAGMLALQYQLEQSQWWTEAELERWQMRQIQVLLRYVRHALPFWRERLDRAGCDPERELTSDLLRLLPVMTRADIQAGGDALRSPSAPADHGKLLQRQSSGSTGEPIVTFGTELTQFFWNALLVREHLWHQRDFSGKLAAIRSKTENASLANWGPAVSAVWETGPMAVLDLSIDLDEQLDWLRRENPDYVLSYATNVHALALRSMELGFRLPRLREVRTYGEALRPDLREAVRKAWDVPLVDCYSCEELGYIALQCPACEHYHVQSEALFVEVLDKEGRTCGPGEIGRVVVTALHNFAMPLIRYANGDYAEVGGPCACGRGLPVLTRILGRQRNMVRLPDGTTHWPSFPSEAWIDVAPIRQVQVIQHTIDHLEVRCVSPREFTDHERARLTTVFQECVGYRFRITLTRVAAIERSPSLKYEDFVSYVA